MMKFMAWIGAIAHIWLSVSALSVTPPLPTPSPRAVECMNKVMSRGVCGPNLWLLLRPIGPFDPKECCDFKRLFACLLSQAKGLQEDAANGPICPDDQIDDLDFFTNTTIEYIEKYKCPGIKWDMCAKLAHWKKGRHPLRNGLAKLQADQGYNYCMDSLNADTQCMAVWNGINCREEFVDNVCTEEEVLAVREYNEWLIQDIDSGLCRSDVVLDQ